MIHQVDVVIRLAPRAVLDTGLLNDIAEMIVCEAGDVMAAAVQRSG
jgi:hypothetical protein